MGAVQSVNRSAVSRFDVWLANAARRQVKSQKAEAELPEFDLGKKVGRKIGLQRHRRAVVLCVVDAADFDGSLPRVALQGLFSNIEGYQACFNTLHA
jgi:hypothetical protein